MEEGEKAEVLPVGGPPAAVFFFRKVGEGEARASCRCSYSVSTATYYNAICTLLENCPPANHYLASIGTYPDTLDLGKYVLAHYEG